MGTLFSDPFPERFCQILQRFRAHFWFTFRDPGVLGWTWEATNKLCKKRFAGLPGILTTGGGWCPIITSGLWLSGVMVPLGPWSLERGRGGPAGNWSRPMVEARWRINQYAITCSPHPLVYVAEFVYATKTSPESQGNRPFFQTALNSNGHLSQNTPGTSTKYWRK